MRWVRFATICALAVLPAMALAEVGKGTPKPVSSTGVVPSASADPKTLETPDQKKRRVDYTASTTRKITAITKKQKQTPEMKTLVKAHWRTALRLLGVQRIAENTKKAAVAKRAADTLTKEDTRFFAKLTQLVKAATPADGGTK
jgi:hypothetical protein